MIVIVRLLVDIINLLIINLNECLVAAHVFQLRSFQVLLQAMQFYSNKLNIFFQQQQHARTVIITFQHGMSFCFPFTTGSWGHYISALTKVPDLFSCCQK